MSHTDAVIVATARTPIGKAYRGAFNNLNGASLGAVPVKEAVSRAGVDLAEIEDCIFGCGLPQGATGMNIARQIALRAGLPVTTLTMTNSVGFRFEYDPRLDLTVQVMCDDEAGFFRL